MTLIMLLIACGGEANMSETDTFFCLDERGYEHEPGAFWICDEDCGKCSCGEDGKVFATEDGPIISTEGCEKTLRPEFPPSPK